VWFHQQRRGHNQKGYTSPVSHPIVCGSAWLAAVRSDAARRKSRSANWIFQATGTARPIEWQVDQPLADGHLGDALGGQQGRESLP